MPLEIGAPRREIRGFPELRDHVCFFGRPDVDIRVCRPVLASGIGDMLEPVPGIPALHLVLVNPGTSLSTPDVFLALACRDNRAAAPFSPY